MKYDHVSNYFGLSIDEKAKTIKHLMIDTGMSQADIANGADIKQGDISKLLAINGAHRTLDKALGFLFSKLNEAHSDT
jgi:predicted XRE-type DNA-binding protein